MNILHIVAGMDPVQGGVSTAIQTMISGFAGSTIRNEVVCLDKTNEPFLKKYSFPVHALGPGKGPWHYAPLLVPWLEKNYPRFDVVIIHGLWLYHSFAARKALKKLKNTRGRKTGNVPQLFVMPHGMLDPYFQKAAGRQLKALRNWVYWKLIEAKLINSAAGLLFTCKIESSRAATAFSPYSPQHQVVVGLGVEKPPSYDEKMSTAFLAKCPGLNTEPYLLYLGRIHEKKGLDLLITAYNELVKNGYQFPRLVIAGPGLESAYGNKIRNYVSENFLTCRIFFPGMLTGNEKWGAIYNCEAFVLPSHQENFGIAIVEAMACGKAILITDQINIYQEIQEAGAGIIKNDSLKEISALLKSWVDLSGAEKNMMRSKARNLYETYYSVDLATKRLLHAISLYKTTNKIR